MQDQIIKDIISTIEKIKKIKIEKEYSENPNSVRLTVIMDKETFIIPIALYKGLIMMSFTNPLSYEKDKSAIISIKSMNEFNRRVFPVKGSVIDEKAKKLIFVREEFIRKEDVFNKDIVCEKLEHSKELVQSAPFVYFSLPNTMKDEG